MFVILWFLLLQRRNQGYRAYAKALDASPFQHDWSSYGLMLITLYGSMYVPCLRLWEGFLHLVAIRINDHFTVFFVEGGFLRQRQNIQNQFGRAT